MLAQPDQITTKVQSGVRTRNSLVLKDFRSESPLLVLPILLDIDPVSCQSKEGVFGHLSSPGISSDGNVSRGSLAIVSFVLFINKMVDEQ